MGSRLSRQKEIVLQLLEEGIRLPASSFNVSNQCEVLGFLEKKDLVTRYWNDPKKKDFKWNVIAKNQVKKAREFLGLNSLSDEVQES